MITEYMEKEYRVITDEQSFTITFYYRPQDPEFDERTQAKDGISGQTGLNAMLIMTQALADEAEYTQWPGEAGVFVLRSLEDCYVGEKT